MNPESEHRPRDRTVAIASMTSALLLWLSQPPLALWPIAFVVFVPLLSLVELPRALTRAECVLIWLGTAVYWAITLQGLRHAHPVIYVAWLALAMYLAIYTLLFVIVCRRMVALGLPLFLSAPIAWVGQECVRNYLLTGISTNMLGHTMVAVPSMIQIADIFGSYGVSFVVMTVNVAALSVWKVGRFGIPFKTAIAPVAIAGAAIVATLAYGRKQLEYQPQGELATFALVQRNEPIEFGQDDQRQREIFTNLHARVRRCSVDR